MSTRRARSMTCWLTVLLLVLPHPTSSVLIRRSLAKYRDAVCTDGSPAAYYHTPVDHHRARGHYVIFLEGGGYCPSVADCHVRCGIAPRLCTSPRAVMRDHHGILSVDPSVNPGMADYYKVALPYCTGDMYVGRRVGSSDTDQLHFQGRAVLDALIDSLLRHTSIGAADRVVLSGSSAGGAGVVFNCERVRARLPGVWCVVDAAFFYPVHQPLHNASSCQSVDRVLQLGARLWAAPELATFNMSAWWTLLPPHDKVFLGISKYDLFGFESFCGDFDNATDREIWGSGVWRLTRRLLAERPGVGLFSAACRYHMVLHTDGLFNRLRAAGAGTTYAGALTHWLAGDDPATYQAWDDCEHGGYCNELCDDAGQPDTREMTRH